MVGLIDGIIAVLFVALGIILLCVIATKLAKQLLPDAAAYTWIVWALGGLFLLGYALQRFAPNLAL